MFSAEQQTKKIEITVAEAFVSVQVIDRAFQRGVIAGSEAVTVGAVRNSLVANMAHHTGVNVDQPQQAKAPVADETPAE